MFGHDSAPSYAVFKINHPSEVISEGQTVEVKILTVDADKNPKHLVMTLTRAKLEELVADLIDATKTPMGGRMLRRRILAPLTDVAAIRRRHDAVEAFLADGSARSAVREAMQRIGDLERLATRITPEDGWFRLLRATPVQAEFSLGGGRRPE